MGLMLQIADLEVKGVLQICSTLLSDREPDLNTAKSRWIRDGRIPKRKLNYELRRGFTTRLQSFREVTF